MQTQKIIKDFIKESVQSISINLLKEIKDEYRKYGIDLETLNLYLPNLKDEIDLEVSNDFGKYLGHNEYITTYEISNETLTNILYENKELQEYAIELIKDRLWEVA